MQTFPTNIACIVLRDYKEKFPEDRHYLGRKSIDGSAHIKATMLLENDANAMAFLLWYITYIYGGTGAFTVQLPFFGVDKLWTVKIVNNIEAQLKNKNGAREVALELEIVADTARMYHK